MSSRPLPSGRLHRLHRLPVAAATVIGVLGLGVGLGACGSSASSGGSASGTQPTGSAPTSLASMSGRQIFETQGCAGCHTLAAAGSVGNVGPDLDTLKPSYAAVVHQVINGGGAMPSFRGQLNAAEIARVARFVSSSTH